MNGDNRHLYNIDSEDLIVQSGEATAETETNEVVTIESGLHDTKSVYAAIYDSVVSDIYTTDYELGNFLSRPTKLYHETFTPGAPYATIDKFVWKDFFNNAYIKKKIDNYAYIQCKMKIKVIVNSTPFVYGLIGVSYAPQTGLTAISNFSNSTILQSQRPTIWVDLSKSQGGEMEFPFFHYKNWLELNLSADLDSFGQLKIWQIVQAQAANAGITSTASLTVYAWLEDVRLYGNTVNLTVQSSEGVVSGTAQQVANIADYFGDIPIIGRFAKATSIGARAVSAIATMFGFTNTPVIKSAEPIKSQPFHGLASAHISNVVDKLVLDPQNELTISPETVGLQACDELSISHLISKEAILATPVWNTTDATSQLLFSANVTPTMCQLNTATANQTVLLDTPMGMTSRMFSHWRGDIYFRVKIIKSPYHKGRLVVNYDPTGDINTTSDNNNVVQTVIVDLSLKDEVLFRVPYMAPQSFLKITDTLRTDYGSRTAATGYDDDFDNGRFTIRVLNNLTAPLDTAAVTLVISVFGAENMEFGNPSDVRFTNHSGSYPSNWVIQSTETGSDDTTEKVEEYCLGKATPTPQFVYDVNFGEKVASLRELLRRSNLVNRELAFLNTAGTDFNYYSLYHSKYPNCFGYDSNGIHGAAGINAPIADTNFNYCHVNPFTFLQGCFIGMRGSMIWHYNLLSQDDVDKISVRRLYTNIRNGTAVTTRATLRNTTYNCVGTTYSGAARFTMTRETSGLGGISLINQRTQSGLSVLYPQYSKFRFVSCDVDNTTYGIAEDDTIDEKFSLDIVSNNKQATTVAYDRYVSIGPDFNFFYFLNVPPRYCHAVPSAAAF